MDVVMLFPDIDLTGAARAEMPARLQLPSDHSVGGEWAPSFLPENLPVPHIR